MNIEFKCENCGQPMSIDKEHAGKQANCPECGVEFTIPTVNQIPKQPDEKFCSNCGKKIDEGIKFCPSCGNPISIVDKGEANERLVLGEPKPKKSFEKTGQGKELKNAKILGGTGAILSLLGVIPVIGWMFSLTGIVLVFIAVKKIANTVKRSQIFKDYIKALIFDLIAIPVSLMVYMGTIGGASRLTDQFRDMGSLDDLQIFSAGVIFAFLALVVALIGVGYFARKSFIGIAEETGQDNFKTAGNIFFISGILTIILVGFIGFFIGMIFEAIAFFSLPEELPERSG